MRCYRCIQDSEMPGMWTPPAQPPLHPDATSHTACRACCAGALAAALLLAASPASAELNKFEYEIGGEFGVGTAQQYGEADLKVHGF